MYRAAAAQAARLSSKARGAAKRAQTTRRERALRSPAEKTTAGDVFVLSVPLFVELFMQIMIGNINQFMLRRWEPSRPPRWETRCRSSTS